MFAGVNLTWGNSYADGEGVAAGGKIFSLPGYPAINCVTPEPNCCAASNGCNACLDAPCIRLVQHHTIF